MKKYESFYKLLRETDVKEVVEAIGRMYYADKLEEKCPYAYKGAYDQLMSMPKEEIADNDGYAVHVYNYHEAEKPFALTNCEGMAWKTALALPVIVEDSIVLTPTETVAAIIWALTYYGFSEREAKDFFEELDEEIEEEGKTTLEEFWDDEDVEDEEEEDSVPLTPEEEERKRLEERAEKVERAMMELLSQSEGLEVKDLVYLLDTSLICQIWPHTYVNDTDKRMDYLLELIEDYSEVKQGFNRAALCVTSSPDYPLTDEEEKMLVEKLQNMINCGQVLIAKRYHKKIEKELQAIILFSKD
jgi:hypothetical protein